MVELPPLEVALRVHRQFPWIYHWFYGGLAAAMRHYGLELTSLYRTPERNALVGGSPDSQHLVGLAADLVRQDGVVGALDGLRRLGFQVVPYSDHLHVQALPAGELRRAGLLPSP